MNYKWFIKGLDKVPGGKALMSLLYKYRRPVLAREVFGLNFSSPLGLGAGFDLKGKSYDILAEMGLSFAEIGPISASNARSSVSHIIEKRSGCIPAVNITKGLHSDLDANIVKDYLDTFSLVYDFAEMFVLDFKDLDTDLELVTEIVDGVLDIRLTSDEYKPVLIGLGYGRSEEELKILVDHCMMSGADGIVACGIENIKHISEYSKGRWPIIAYDGIRTPEAALQLLDAGASLLALKEELLEFGPSHVKRILKAIEKSEQAKERK